MLKFEKYEGSFGIPIYHEQLPEAIKASAIMLVVFVGSADDESVGEHGIYHWFEHLPFRGTRRFPDGYTDINGRISRLGGDINASTSIFNTRYYAAVPTRFLGDALDVIVDMVANPLLTSEAIEAERTVIHQEIGNKLGSLRGTLGYTFNNAMFPDHPIGHPVVGSIESLNRMTPEHLREARLKGYDQSRMAFFVSTSLPIDAFMDLLGKRFDELPQPGLSKRHRNASYGKLVWPDRKRTIIETNFGSSMLIKALPTKTTKDWPDRLTQVMISNMFSFGGLGSPLMRAVREDRQLAYSASFGKYNTPDGAYFEIAVETNRNNLEKTEDALKIMLRDKQLRSKGWFDTIRTSFRNEWEMQVISPRLRVMTAADEVSSLGHPISEEEYYDLLDKVSFDEVVSVIDSLSLDDAYTFIMSGK